MENIAYEIAQWISNNPIYLLAPAGLAAAGVSYIAITFDPAKYKRDTLREDHKKSLEGKFEKEVFKD